MPTNKSTFASLPSTIQTLSILCCITIIVAVLPGIYAGKLFPWHPVFMTIGFLGFMCEGITAAFKLRPTDGPPRVTALQNHMLVQLTATAFILLGFSVIYWNKMLNGKSHFTSLHGKVGLITTILAAVTPSMGLVSFRKYGILDTFPNEWQPVIKWAHRFIAVVTWSLAILTMQLDLPHKDVMQGILCRTWQGCSLALTCAILLMLRGPGPGKTAVLPQTTIDFTAIPQGPKHL